MRKKAIVLCLVVMVAALIALPGMGRAAMWVGAEIGGNFPADTKIKLGGVDVNNVAFKPSVIGGAIIGYDFVNTGFGGRNWPNWMRYFSFAMDITYNNLTIPNQTVTINNLPVVGNLPTANIGKLNGYAVAWTFLFMAHYGFFPDSEVPSGRVVPYIGVGPHILWSALDFGGAGGGTKSSTNVGLTVEPGIRWMAMSNVSIDTAFRYRYTVPQYDVDTAFGTFKVKPDPLNQFSFLVRANYHF